MDYRQETWVDRISSPENSMNYPSDAGAELNTVDAVGEESGVYRTIRVEHDVGPDVQIAIQMSLDRVDWVNKTPDFISGNGKIGRLTKTGRGVLTLVDNTLKFIRVYAEVTGRATAEINDFAAMLPAIVADLAATSVVSSATAAFLIPAINHGMSNALVKRYGSDDTHAVLNVIFTD